MGFTKAVTIVITRILTCTVTNAFVIIAPFHQATVDVILVGVDQSVRGNGRLNQRLDRHLLDVCQHPNDNRSAAFNHAEDGRFFAFKRAASPCALESSPSTGAPFFATSSGCPLCPATM